MPRCRSSLRWRFQYIFYFLYLAAIFFRCCESRKSADHLIIRAAAHSQKISDTNKNRMSPVREILNAILMNRVDNTMMMPTSNGNSQPYGYGVSSPFSLPPIPLPENGPPFCVYPPNFTPQPPAPPSTTVPTPPAPAGGSAGGGYITPPPPPMSPIENPPAPSPPAMIIPIPNPPPAPSIPVPPPPSYFSPSPPPPTATGGEGGPSPPISYVPRPPSPVPVFLPPIVYPPPAVLPPPHVAPAMALWCVAKPSVPDPIVQEAMNYACASGADCDQIQPSGSCFQPNTLLAHASYAFNSYWQRTKVAGGSCEFGGTAMLVTVDPSYDGCHFIYF